MKVKFTLELDDKVVEDFVYVDNGIDNESLDDMLNMHLLNRVSYNWEQLEN